MLAGMVVVYAAGVAWLAAYIPANQLVSAGILPFLLGDFMKIGAVAAGSLLLPTVTAGLRGESE
jgi:biotin transport system substrate-specific component